MSKKQVLFASFEAVPFFKSGGLGDVAGTLPGEINNSEDYDVRVVMPKLKAIPDQYVKEMKFIDSFTVPVGWRNQYCGLFELEHANTKFYFLDNEYYFYRSKPYGEFDDGERMAFFSRAILECIAHIEGFEPKILHCNDWHTALAPVFLRECYMDRPVLKDMKTIFTVHNLKFQGQYSDSVLWNVLGLGGTPAENQLLSADRHSVNFVQGALRYSDRLTTVSPTYANEICYAYYGENMDHIYRERKNVLSGIINGIDYDFYNPETDKFLPENFNFETIEKKAVNKAKIQEELGLDVDPNVPLFVLISRLTEQKGLDLVVRIMNEMMHRDMQLVILGVGDEQYEEAFAENAYYYGHKMAAVLRFDIGLSNRLYGAADVMLIPSRFEPCGLTQMMSMRYGTIPLVRETGGLKDTVIPYNKFTGEGNGFSFVNFNAHELLTTIEDAIDTYKNKPEAWKYLVKNAMEADFSWKNSAKEYIKLYEGLLEE